MGKRERYEPGAFCWADLATTDPEGAKAFYGGLFGWEAEDVVGGDGGAYTMLKLGGDEVAALYEMEPTRRETGVPAHWFSYVSVESADAAATRAAELGGKAYGEPRDAGALGRMAVVGDPMGAVLGAWEPRAFPGARRVNDPGCMTWNELRSPEPGPAADFYAGLFGWEAEPMTGEDGRVAYVILKNAGRSNGGVMPTTEARSAAPPYWLAYFTVPSCREALATVRELGGTVVAGPLDIGAGEISVATDPQGAAFAVYEGETDG